ERLTNFAGALVAPRIAWAGALLALSVGIFLARVAVSPTVSANAVLERARISEKTSRASVQHPVVYQKLRIRSQGGTVTRTIYRDLFSGRKSDSSDASQVTLAALRTRMQEVNLDWQDPLSIASFIAWHASLSEKTDEVTRANGGLLVVHTKVLNGPLSEVQLTLRDGDYHAIAETLRFQDENIEMSEVDFSVLALESVNPAIFEPPSSPQPAALPGRPTVSEPSISELVHSEAEARVALHMLGADLGEPIDISSDGKEVLVSGLVDTSERRQGLLQALQMIPHLQINLVSAAEAEEKTDHLALKDDNPVVAVESPPLLERELHATFPDPTARIRFVNDVLETTMNAAGRAWSLRRLSDRYTSDISSRMDILTERKVELLIRDDAGLLQQQLDNLRLLLMQLTPEMLPDHSTGAEAEDDDADPADWHWGVDSAFSDSQRIQSDISVLFSGVDNHNTDTQAILRDLLLAIRRTDKRLPVLCREVSGNFLTAADRDVGIQELGDYKVQK
ncbi:MAG TPA: hypothetical protein VNO32_47450, partial [Candidatus Acidoferrum sp.]|nr:hypothetical protein [Candidatus Acidoferrum sp.]